MKDTTKGVVLGLVFGISLSVLGGAAVMMLVVTPKMNEANQKWADALNDTVKTQASTCHQLLLDQHQRDTSNAVSANTAIDGYTSLLEPTPAKSSAALQLFDVVRPGLGTMLAKLQAAQAPQIAVKWVVPGHVKALSNSPGYSYCWLSASGDVDTANCPVAGGAQ